MDYLPAYLLYLLCFVTHTGVAEMVILFLEGCVFSLLRKRFIMLCEFSWEKMDFFSRYKSTRCEQTMT
jgi:hypothetical protein